MEQTLVDSLLSFALYFGVSLVLLLAFKFFYVLVTPHDEWTLIKDEQNAAASIAFGGAVIGFSIALGSAVSNSISLIDFVIWAGVALVAQLAAFGVVRFLFMPQIIARIKNKENSAAIMLAAVSISVGILNAACMTY